MAFHRCNCCRIDWPGNNRLEHRAHCCESSTSPFTSASRNRFNWTFVFFLLVAPSNNHQHNILISRGKSKYIRIQSAAAEKNTFVKSHRYADHKCRCGSLDKVLKSHSGLWVSPFSLSLFLLVFHSSFLRQRRGKINSEKYKKQLQNLWMKCKKKEIPFRWWWWAVGRWVKWRFVSYIFWFPSYHV